MDENPYHPPAEASELSERQSDPLRLPAIGCIGSGMLGVVLAICQFVFSLQFLRLAKQAESLRAINEAHEMTMGSYGMAGLSLLALVSAVCIFRRRFRWLVIASGVVGIVTCIPAPLAVIVLMRLWKKDVWNSFG